MLCGLFRVWGKIDAIIVGAFNVKSIPIEVKYAFFDRLLLEEHLGELMGNGTGIRGMNGDLEKAYKALSIDTKGLDPICLGCHNKGVRYGSI